MATFTMNSQQNLVPATSAKGIFDKAFAFSILLVILVGGIWAAERVLIYLADQKIAEHQATTTASLEAVSAEDVQAVHDVTSRVAAIQNQNAAKIDVAGILAALERSTIPQVRLTEYEYKADGLIIIKGVVSDYRFLAEQILRYRQESLFSTTEVRNTSRNDSGQVTFELEAAAEQAAEQPAGTPESAPLI